MSIQELGYLDFFGEKCFYVQEGMDYILLPVDEGANIYRHYLEENYLLSISSRHNSKCVASVKKQRGFGTHGVCLELNYIAKRHLNELIDGFVMTGNEIDEFFSPLEYYSWIRRQDKYEQVDLLYNQEIIADYSFCYKGRQINVQLAFGNVLSPGIRSDLTIHPKLIVSFESTDDTDFVFGVSNVLVRFLQFVHRKRTYNIANLNLFKKTGVEQISFIGYMFGSLYNRDLRASSRIDASFVYYGDKIDKLLDLIAQENGFPVNHLSQNTGDRYNYKTERIGAISAAFEYEYNKSDAVSQKSIFECPITKQNLLDFIDQMKNLHSEENADSFLEIAANKVSAIGTQVGLKQKIVNAFQVNKGALESSSEWLFARNKSVEKVADAFSRLRGKVLHYDSGHRFSDTEIEVITFIEVLQFVMVLKRAKYTDAEIELILGPQYNCNDKYMEILMKSDS